MSRFKELILDFNFYNNFLEVALPTLDKLWIIWKCRLYGGDI